MLRFLADEYDDTCDTVFPMLQGILASVSAHISGILVIFTDLFSINVAERWQPVHWTSQYEHFWRRYCE